MRRGLQFIFFLLFAAQINANSLKKDSLKTLLSGTISDSVRCNLLIKLGNEVISNTPVEAYEYFQNALVLSTQLKDTNLIVRSLLGIGHYNALVCEYSEALSVTLQSVKLSKNNNRLLALSYTRLSSLYHYMEEFDKAIEHIKTSLEISIGERDSIFISEQLHNMGVLYLEKDFFDSALICFNMSQGFFIKIHGYPDSYNLSHIGHTYTYMNEFDSALYYQFEAFKYDSLFAHNYEMAVDDYYIAYAYSRMNKHNKAIEYASKSIDRIMDLKNPEILLFNYELLKNTYEKKGNYELAYKYANLCLDYNDTIKKSSNDEALRIIEAKYKFEDQKRKLIEKETENIVLDKQKKLLIILIIISLLLFIAMIFIVIQLYNRNNANHELLEQLEKANHSKERIISVISHDLRTSIGTLRNAVDFLLKDSIDHDTMKELMHSFYPVINSTYDLLENMLTWSKYNQENLIANIGVFDIKLITQRSINHIIHLADSKNVTIVNNIESTFIKGDKDMLQTILRNLISNAVKFSQPKSFVIIDCTSTKSFAEISVKDVGIGMERKMLNNLFLTPVDFHTKGTMGERGSGLGLSICKDFIVAQNGKIWAVSELGKGSCFSFTIPIKN